MDKGTHEAGEIPPPDFTLEITDDDGELIRFFLWRDGRIDWERARHPIRINFGRRRVTWNLQRMKIFSPRTEYNWMRICAPVIDAAFAELGRQADD